MKLFIFRNPARARRCWFATKKGIFQVESDDQQFIVYIFTPRSYQWIVLDPIQRKKDVLNSNVSKSID